VKQLPTLSNAIPAAVACRAGVLDLTGRADIEPVRRMLANHQVRFPAPDLWQVQ